MNRILAITASFLFSAAASAQLVCTVTSAGESCGPNLAVSFAPVGNAGNYTITMTATGLHPNSLLGLYWGDAPLSLPIPGSSCLLLINPIWGTFHTTDATGSFSYGRTWPHWATADYYMQMGSINANNQILSTNAKLASCW